MADDEPVWPCGAFQPVAAPLQPYRCTEPDGHGGPVHRAFIDGELVAQWPRRGQQ